MELSNKEQRVLGGLVRQRLLQIGDEEYLDDPNVQWQPASPEVKTSTYSPYVNNNRDYPAGGLLRAKIEPRTGFTKVVAVVCKAIDRGAYLEVRQGSKVLVRKLSRREDTLQVDKPVILAPDEAWTATVLWNISALQRPKKPVNIRYILETTEHLHRNHERDVLLGLLKKMG